MRPPSIPHHSIKKDGEIHVWHVRLDHTSSSVMPLFETLSPDEQDRANRYRFLKDRHSYVIARGMLRKILGSYLKLLPGNIRFNYNRYGKPFLDDRNSGLRFNVSHSQRIALIAITLGQDVGIDIEYKNHDFDFMHAARVVFSAEEYSRLTALSPAARWEAFFRGWTRKEAVLKAIGGGFAGTRAGLTSFRLRDEQHMSFTSPTPGNDQMWTVQLLPTEPGYTGAVAAEGKIETIRFCEGNIPLGLNRT